MQSVFTRVKNENIPVFEWHYIEKGVKSQMKKISQETVVLNHLKRYGTITSMEAFSKYQITRLSAIVHTLRHKRGYDIQTLMVYKNGTHFARYTMLPH